MLASLLKDTGYTTGGVVACPWLERVFGLGRGFEYYDDGRIDTLNGKRASDVTSSAINWIEKCREKKFFLFLNYYDPHKPYSPPEGYASVFLPKGTVLPNERKRSLYDAEILYMDYYIGQLLTRLKQLDLYDNTWIIVTSDHGEELGERGKFGHGKSLYQEEIHIPLIMKYPAKEAAAGRNDIRVQLVDIFAMVLKQVGIAQPEGIQGEVPPNITHPIVAEVYPVSTKNRDSDWRAIFEEDLKFMWNSKGQHVLVNLNADPREKVNLAEQQPQQVRAMILNVNQYLDGLPKPAPAGPAQELDEETKKALKSLGYVE
jgi:arylsulfatase A-like enzyme